MDTTLYCVTIFTRDNDAIDYRDLEGSSADEVKTEVLSHFQREHPGKVVESAVCILATDYYNAHQCRDSAGDGCCDTCGGVILGSPLWKRINGGD